MILKLTNQRQSTNLSAMVAIVLLKTKLCTFTNN